MYATGGPSGDSLLVARQTIAAGFTGPEFQLAPSLPATSWYNVRFVSKNGDDARASVNGYP
jgi:hypothetical protein